MNVKYYLFSNFPINVQLFSQLPITIIPGVYLDYTPIQEMNHAHGINYSREENIAWAGVAYPGFGLNIGMPHFCIKIDSSIIDSEKDTLFWLTISALFMVKPLFINITGAFYLGDRENGFVKDPQIIGLRSNLRLDAIETKLNISFDKFYNEDDIKNARLLIERMVFVRRSQATMPRLNYNLNIFFQMSFWEKLSYENSIFSKLFALLDSFAGNPSRKQEKKVSENLSSFLQGFDGV